MTTKEIEDYINTHRLYPDEYKGKRDKHTLYLMNHGYKYNPKNNTITKLEGRINDNGDFELIGSFTFPVGRPEEKVPVEENIIDMEHVTEAYNRIITDLGYEDRVIGTPRTKNWNLRDMVCEIEYIRSVYYTEGEERNKLRYEDYATWNRHCSRLRNFIRNYKDHIDDLVCTDNHNSKYDN